MTQPDAYRIALAQNVATNGRLFCILLAAANYATGHPFGVAYAAVPVGFAWASDLASHPTLKRGWAHSSIVTASILAILTFLNCW
ncbi:MAG: hypothetical protein E5W41_00320 [Mesorhizobium sp.]|nr:MAG: hypothetical protein E5W41_00320 [Mesorhizobium sp.]